MFSKLSILIPCFNEAMSVADTIQKVLKANLGYFLEKEIIIVDDGSTDTTFEIVQAFAVKFPGQVLLIRNEYNSGKGYSVMTALQKATGDIVVVQDADLEYDPADYSKMLRPIMEGHAEDVVLGYRFSGEGPHRVLFYFHTIGNKLLTFLSNWYRRVDRFWKDLTTQNDR